MTNNSAKYLVFNEQGSPLWTSQTLIRADHSDGDDHGAVDDDDCGGDGAAQGVDDGDDDVAKGDADDDDDDINTSALTSLAWFLTKLYQANYHLIFVESYFSGSNDIKWFNRAIDDYYMIYIT